MLPSGCLQASGVYLARAEALYKLAQKWPKTTYSRSVESSAVYPSTSFWDDMAFAAIWCVLAGWLHAQAIRPRASEYKARPIT